MLLHPVQEDALLTNMLAGIAYPSKTYAMAGLQCMNIIVWCAVWLAFGEDNPEDYEDVWLAGWLSRLVAGAYLPATFQ